jgi:hypothetical protein
MDWYAVAGAMAALLALGLLSTLLMRARREAGRFRVLDQIARVFDGAEGLAETLEAICDVLVPGVVQPRGLGQQDRGRARPLTAGALDDDAAALAVTPAEGRRRPSAEIYSRARAATPSVVLRRPHRKPVSARLGTG